MSVQQTKRVNYLILLSILAWASGTDASDKNNPPIPLSAIKVANLSLGTTVEQYKQLNAEAKFKRIEKNGLYHHDELVNEQESEKGSRKTVLFADQEGVIYRIEHSRHYSRPLESDAIRRELYKTYGNPVATDYQTHLSTYCWHGCSGQAGMYNNYSGYTEGLIVYKNRPQFYIVVHDYSKYLIRQFKEAGMSEQLDDGWIAFYLIDGKRQTAVDDKWEKIFHAPTAEDQKVDISPNRRYQ